MCNRLLGGGWSLFSHPVGLGILVGLMVGKQLGVVAMTWVAVKIGVADLPGGSGWLQIWGLGLLAGIGFTMSLFINELAFTDPTLRNTGKTAILVASTAAALLGYSLLRLTSEAPSPKAR